MEEKEGYSLWKWFIGVTTILGFVCDFGGVKTLLTEWVYTEIIWERPYDKNIGGILFSESPIYKEPTTIDYGWNPKVSFNSQKLKEDITFNLVNKKGNSLLQLHPKRDGSVLLTVDVFNSNAILVARVVNNELLYFIDEGFMFNLDGTGFEVINEDFLILFNIDYLNNEILINGVLYDNDCSWIIIGDPSPNNELKLEDLMCEYRQDIDLMFCYVGKDYIGKRQPCEHD